MGFLKNIISDAVSDGIGKGIQDAVGKAVESAVKPAADKLAGQAATSLNNAADDLAKTAGEAKAAAGEAAGSLAEADAAAKNAGFANLGAALGSWTNAMQGVAADMAQNMKECPKCGEIVPADQKFCPKCGAELPAESIGAGYVCPKCGKRNLPETVFCTECGTMLPAVAKANEAVLNDWDGKLSAYPKWSLGGVLELDEGDPMGGQPSYTLRVGNVGKDELSQYVAALRAEGFIPAYEGDSDIYYKVVDGVCRAFDKTDADEGDGLRVSFFVGDYDQKAERKSGSGSFGGPRGSGKAEDVADKLGDVTAKIGNAAGMLGGLFGKKK